MYRDESPPPPVEFDKIPYKPRKTALGDGECIEENTNPIFIRYTELGEGLIEPVKPMPSFGMGGNASPLNARNVIMIWNLSLDG